MNGRLNFRRGELGAYSGSFSRMACFCFGRFSVVGLLGGLLDRHFWEFKGPRGDIIRLSRPCQFLYNTT